MLALIMIKTRPYIREGLKIAINGRGNSGAEITGNLATIVLIVIAAIVIECGKKIAAFHFRVGICLAVCLARIAGSNA